MKMYCELQKMIEGAADETNCPLISKMAEGTHYAYTVAMDDLSVCENKLILTSLVNLFANGDYDDALSFLALLFSLCDMEPASEIVAAVGASGDEHCAKTFLAKFFVLGAGELNDVMK